MEATAGLKEQADALGFDLVGVCPVSPPPHFEAYKSWLEKGYHGTMEYLANHQTLKSDPRQLLPSAQSLIVVGLNYNQPNPIQEGKPHIARYALGRDYHKVLRGKLKKLQTWLETTYPNSEHRICVDSAPIMERDFANLAGLGWFGKNTMLINSQRGSWFFIGILMTSVEFHPDHPAIGGCGTCKACIEACPTGAIVFEEERWQVDARRCISYLTIEHRGEIASGLADRMGNWTFGCDVCQEVCPFNQPRESQPLRATCTSESDFLARRDWPDLVQLPQLESGAWDALTQGSAIRRTGPEGIRRNARVNLENRGSKS
jgi:epoxyqueuosine reductase